MGAKHRAQARGKKAKGSMKGNPVSQKKLNQSIQVPSLESSSRAHALQNWKVFANGDGNDMSMRQVARNTDRHTLGWSVAPLRNNAVTFVSAGTLSREETLETDDVKNGEHRNEELVDTEEPNSHEPLSVETELAEQEVIDERAQEPESMQAPDGGKLAPPALGMREQPNPFYSPSAVDSQHSSDSEEEIVFKGRQNSVQPSRKSTPKPDIELKIESAAQKVTEPVPIPVAKHVQIPLRNSAPSTLGASSSAPRSMNSRLRHKRHMLRGFDDDEAIMQDYIDNMALDDSEESEQPQQTSKSSRRNEHFRFHKGSGEEHMKVQTLSYTRKTETKGSISQAIDWDSDDLADFDGLSTTDEEIDEVSHVLRHRERNTGPQYLVVSNGHEASDAKWVLQRKLVSESATKEIQIYEEIRTMNIEQEEDDDDDDDDESSDDEEEEALQDLIDDIESEDDENERIFRHTSRMTDEQIARALAKQEELGMGSEELLLLNGDVGDDDFLEDDAFGLGQDFISFSSRRKKPSRAARKQRDSFPDAEAFADALDQDPYGAFDVMDFDRPSLRPKKKGRKSDYPDYLNAVEDEDLRHQLVSTWTKDREKKAARKREKEEARLNASLDAADGSDPAIIKLRIRQFLVQDVDVLKLSPMESAVRAAVHRLAKALKLNSRSEGKEGVGVGRYPVLTKTAKTPSYSIHNIWEIDALMNTKKFFPKNAFKSSKLPRGGGNTRPRKGAGGVISGATYRDGEEVAASAPEIGAGNIGRAMLEKMGWTAGMGIGAIGNKGSIDPIKHVVKTTKAGLG